MRNFGRRFKNQETGYKKGSRHKGQDTSKKKGTRFKIDA
jgi:hypothetical protein